MPAGGDDLAAKRHELPEDRLHLLAEGGVIDRERFGLDDDDLGDGLGTAEAVLEQIGGLRGLDLGGERELRRRGASEQPSDKPETDDERQHPDGDGEPWSAGAHTGQGICHR